MTNISQKTLSSKKQAQLFEGLSSVISGLGIADINLFLSDLLGPEEKIMLAKRFAAIVLLDKSYTIYKIAKILNLSSSTVTRLNQKRLAGDYKNILKWIRTNKHRRYDFLELLNSVLTLGGTLPRYGEQSKALRKVLRQ